MSQTRRIHAGVIVSAVIATSLIVGCAGGPRAPAPNVGYEELRETFDGLDLSPLDGRRILLDPGHGGFFPGVVGRDGLREADANLGVALYLRGLLEAAGAEVHMTRTSDRDYLSPADSTLATDLAARVALCDSLLPDVFLSLHHNSNAALDRDLNETQTYYPVGRDGADLDLARSIHRHLVRNLEIRPAKLMAGNFYVLRNAPSGVPSVLGEPSMLSNPEVEAKLVTAEKLELEAQAYFLGLRDYFAGGQPHFAWSPESGGIAFHPDADPDRGGPGLDPSTVEVTVDGARAPWVLGADGRTVFPHFGIPGVLEVAARNLAGRTVAPYRDELLSCGTDGSGRPVTIRWRAYPTADAPDGDALVVWTSDGRLARPVDLLPSSPGALTVNAAHGARLVPAAALPDRDDVLPTWFEAPPATVEDGMQPVSSWSMIHPGRDVPRWTVIDAGPNPELPMIQDRIVANGGYLARLGLASAEIIPYYPTSETGPLWLESPGAVPIVLDATESVPDTLAFRALLPALAGRTIMIDPAGGGPDDQGRAPMGTPGRELNLRIAERLADLLRGAGARPVLTRTDAGWVPKEHKVQLTNRERGDLFLTIARNPAAAFPRLFHHHGSANGERWAVLTRQAMAGTGLDPAAVGPSYAYLLRHTSPPALRCELPLPAREAAEERDRTPAVQQAIAFALFRAIAAYFDGADGGDLPPGWDLASFMARHRGAFPHPDDVDLVRVDGNWLWLPPPSDTPAALLPLRDGPRILEVRSGRDWWVLEAEPAADTIAIRLYGIGEHVLTVDQSGPPRPVVPDARD